MNTSQRCLTRAYTRKVRCDVKIVWGENDQWIPKEKMERLADMLKHRLKVAFEVFVWLAEH